jgi:ERCC4-related helicase
VINNLLIAHVELRAEDDPELAPYTHQRQIEVVVCQQGAYNGIQAVRKHINSLMNFALGKLLAHGMVDCSSAQEVNFLHLKEAER